jgi:biopolymer transport protein ExbB/TolQ
MDQVSLSPVEFFNQAGPVGKAVILLLLVASIWCWTLIIEGVVNSLRFSTALKKWHARNDSPLLKPILDAGHEAFLRTRDLDPGETRQRVVEAMNRRAKKIIARLDGGLANLAVISSVAPFVGLFGTVWGIMASFSAIAQAKDTSLAVVAPGIAEALATTAIGLAAAIPAAIGYNRLGSAISASADDLSGQIEERALDIVAPGHATSLKEVA